MILATEWQIKPETFVNSAKRSLKELWESLHRAYGPDIRFGLREADQKRLLAIEKQFEAAKRSRPGVRRKACGVAVSHDTKRQAISRWEPSNLKNENHTC